MDDYVTHAEFGATVEKLEAEDSRENKRLEKLEDTVAQIHELTRTVDKLAANMENMLKEQTRQGERLEALESRDGEMWRKVASYAATAVIGIIIGFIFKQFGIV